ncbi:hypothetical protein KO489_09860 [Reinekea forsetii]|nr:hypothetical protein [Reinekea forsetii]
MNIQITEAVGRTTSLAIVNSRGAVLIPAGFELSEKVIEALIKQGIESVEVLESNENDVIAEIMQKKIDRIEHLFYPYDSPKMNELKTCLINQTLNS